MAHQRPSGRKLVPSAEAPWLTLASWVRPGARAALGMLLVLPVIIAVGASLDPIRWRNVSLGLFLLMLCILVLIFATFVMVVMQALNRRAYQWCSECLQYMTRGARVCPFCGFRPAGESDAPTVRSGQHTGPASR